VNVIRIAALGVLLAASVAMAQSKKMKEAKAQTPKPVISEKDKPKTCSDQCDLMEKFCVDPCKKGAAENKAAQKACEQNCQQVVAACEGSCKEKGRLDKQYMMEHMKPPPGVKLPPQDKKSSGGKEGQDEH